MILRKPYAFLIKNFKLFHLIMLGFIGYLIYQSSLILEFLNGYVNNVTIIIGTELTEPLFNDFTFAFPFIIIVASIILLSIMIVKEKPFAQYVWNIILYVALISLYTFAHSTIGTMELEIVDIRTVRAVRDFFFMAITLQCLSFAFVFIRATGFDLNKFNFDKDLKELEVETKDNEEFEVNLDLDANLAKRKFNYYKRQAKYIYLEYKNIINISVLIIALFFGYNMYLNSSIFNKNYQVGDYFRTYNFTMSVKEVFKTNKDFDSNKIGDSTLIVLNIDIKNNFIEVAPLNLGKIALVVDGTKLYHTDIYRDDLTDLGIVYESQDISFEGTSYLLVYEVPAHLVNRDMQFIYYDTASFSVETTTFKTDINSIDLDSIDLETNLELGSTYDFKDTIYDNLSVTVDSILLQNSFELKYNFCIADECYDSLEYVKPVFNTNYDESLIRLDGNLVFDKNNMFSSFSDFILDYGYIIYTIEDTTYSFKIKELVKPLRVSTSSIFIEIPSEVLNASVVKLSFNIRNEVVNYTVK